MWHKLRKQVELERGQLDRLLESHRSLLIQCERVSPNPIELSALAAMIHAFYNGIENIFKRINTEIDGCMPAGTFWHRELLDSMMLANAKRPAAISKDLGERLAKYLEFRHVFRHAYTFELRWDKMQPLVLTFETVLTEFEKELSAFLQTGGIQ